MKKGDIVNIYVDPYSRIISEGEASLLKRISIETYMYKLQEVKIEYWRVQFKETGDVVDRLIRA